MGNVGKHVTALTETQQRAGLTEAILAARIGPGELWLNYFARGGAAGEYEVNAYLQGMLSLPALQRDLLAAAANALIDEIPPLPRAPYVLVPASRTHAMEQSTGMACIVSSGLPAADEQAGHADGTTEDEPCGTHEAMLQAVLDTIDVGVAVLDDGGRPVLQNTLFKAMLEHADPQGSGPLGESGLLVFGPDASTPVPAARRTLPGLASGGSFTDELVWVGPPGDLRALNLSVRTTNGPALRGAVVTFTDITPLANALATKEDFLAAVSHELRTPLTSLLGYLELALDDPTGLPPHHHKSIDIAHKNADRLHELVANLLTAAHGTGRPDPIPTDLVDIVRTRVKATAHRAEARRVAISQQLPETLPATVDPQGIGRVLDSLLSNAIKFSPDGGHVIVRATRDGETITLEVQDHGTGMSPEEQREAFTRFYRSPTASQAAIPGAGLGLPIAKQIVEAHQGEIAVKSVRGEGSTFTITLPTHL